MSVYKYTLKNGKTLWYASFYMEDWTGERKRIVKRGFLTQKEAKNYERMCIDKSSSSSSMLFSSLFDNYMEDMRHRLKPTTIEGKEFLITTKILPYFKNMRICDIGPDKIRKWQNELLSFRDGKGKPYSQTYLKTINNQLSAMFNYAVRNYGLKYNPCNSAGSMGKSHAGEMQIWTKDEYDQFIACEPRRAYRVAFDTLFYTGIRRGELLALTPSDILPDRRLRICKSLAFLKDGQTLLMEPKTPKSKRNVTLPDFLYAELSDYASSLYGIQPDDRLFYFTKSGIRSEFVHVMEKAGVKKIRMHDLRHSHASMLIEMGFPPLEIAERLGHESASTTLNVYSHLYPNKDFNIADALEGLRGTEKKNNEADK